MFIKEKKEKAPKEMRLERDPHTLPECVKSRSACGGTYGSTRVFSDE